MNPREIHDRDQAMAAMSHLGAGLGAMFRAVKAEGVPAKEAAIIVAAFAGAMGMPTPKFGP